MGVSIEGTEDLGIWTLGNLTRETSSKEHYSRKVILLQ